MRERRYRLIAYTVTGIVFAVAVATTFYLLSGLPEKSENGGKSVTNADMADALSALDKIRTAFEKSVTAQIAPELAEWEADLKASLKGGWKAPWSNLAPKLTAEEIRSLGTEELTQACLSSGLAARTLLLYSNPTTAIKRLKILYPAFGELFAREDAWRVIPTALVLHARQFDANAPSTQNVNAFMGIVTALDFYRAKGFAYRFAGHERELITAHVSALKRIREYYRAVAEREAIGEDKHYYVCTRTPVLTADWALVLLKRVSPGDYESRTVVTRAALGRKVTRRDVMSYVDAVLAELDRFLRTPK